MYPLKKSIFVVISSLLLFLSTTKAQPLDPQYENYNKRLSINPKKVLNELLASPANQQNPLLAAEYQYTLSQAYLTLVYPNESLEAANKALQLLKDQQADWLYHKILISKSQAMELNGLAQEALPLAQQALQWAQQHQDSTLTVDALVALGYIENTLGHSLAALDFFMRAYNKAPSTGVEPTKSAIASSLALVYQYRREDQLAIPYFEEAVAYQRAQKNLLELSIALYGLGRANKNMGQTVLGQKQLQESLDISRAIDDEQGVAYALKELAPLKMQADELEQAESMLNEAALIFAKSENKYMLFDIHKTLAQLYLMKQDITKALKKIEQAKPFLNEKRMPMQAIILTELEAQITAAQGLYELAYQQLIGTLSKKQKILSESSTQQLHELRTQFDMETQAKENLLLAQENAEQKLNLLQQKQNNQLLLIGLISAACVVTLLALLAYRSRTQKQQLFKLANIDQLTGIPNRAHVKDLLKHNKAQLLPHQTMHLVMIDLDHFKQINDQLGHEVGDHVLKHIGQLCRDNINKPNIAGRFGGEEFLLAFVNCTTEEVKQNIQHMRQHAEKIAHKIKQELDTECPFIGFSAGICTCQNNSSLTECIKKADLAMYQAKNSGRNRTVVATVL